MLRQVFRYLLPVRSFILLVAYTGIFVATLYVSYLLRFEFEIPDSWIQVYLSNLIWVIPLKLTMLFVFGQFGGLLSYFRMPDLYRVFAAVSLSSAFLIIIWYLVDGRECPPRSVILSDLALSLIAICFLRVLLRLLREQQAGIKPNINEDRFRVAIIGAGDVGATVAADLLSRRGLGLKPVVFLDDDRTKWRKQIHGISVVDTPDNLQAAQAKFGFEKIIIAMPSAPAKRIREIVEKANALKIDAEIMPSLIELSTGRVRADRIRPVEVDDLLGRDPVALDSDKIASMLAGRIVMVTGAGGSIGAELCRQIASQNPARLLLVDQSEVQLFQIEQNLIEDGYGGIITPLIADIMDLERMDGILSRFGPSTIFHAAAHKHVFLMERQPAEAIKNNSLGTAKLADLACQHKVGKFVLVSTDKAINPTSVMGASKRLAELYLQARGNGTDCATAFVAVRFGNVLGSSGSVVPIFRKQIARGGPVTVTHKDVTRYFMTIPEAVGLVLQSASMGAGGEIFVLDMGEPVKIIDLAEQMIRLSGFTPYEDIDIEIVGLRPGEKLYEELQHNNETFQKTNHPRVRQFVSTPISVEDASRMRDMLSAQVNSADKDAIRALIKQFIPEYTPFLD